MPGGSRATVEVHGPLGSLTVRGSADDALAQVASAQHGVVSRAQLATIGLGRGGISRRVAAGRLHRLHRGVYAVGHTALAPLGRETAALLACCGDAVVSHGSAATLWGFWPASDGPAEVTVTSRDCRSRPNLRVHRASGLGVEDIRRRHGIPVTSPARTLLDVAGRLDAHDLARAFDEAIVARVVRHSEVAALLPRVGGRPGSTTLRALIADREGPRITRSEAERRLLALVASARLPAPRANARLGRYEVDALWPDRRLVVEVDGYAFHSSRAAFERDRARDADLQAQGFRVLRVTWRQLVGEPEATVARIARLLGPAT